jgi:hypothetical protein
MQQVGLARNGGKFLASIIHLLKPDFMNMAPEDAYFGYLQKQNKSPKNNAVIVLWSLLDYLMENTGDNASKLLPLNLKNFISFFQSFLFRSKNF